MGQLTRIQPEQSNSVVSWQEPPLPTKLDAAVKSRINVFELPVPGPQFLPALRVVVAAQPPLATHTDINGWVIKLSTVMPMRKMSATDAAVAVGAYLEGLSDLAACDLDRACAHLLRNSKFMPTVAEIREQAAKLSSVRRYRQHRASMLIMRHEREWTGPVADGTAVDCSDVVAAALAQRSSAR